jgi:hypothetical protein
VSRCIFAFPFAVPPTPEDAMEQLRTSIVKNIDQVIANAVKEAIHDEKP